MYSNVITPPDFVNDQFHTVTIVNAAEDDVKMLVHLCQNSDIAYNIYLYKDEMNDRKWLDAAINKSHAVILHNISSSHNDLLFLDNAYYYGSELFACPATKINTVLDYFNQVK